MGKGRVWGGEGWGRARVTVRVRVGVGVRVTVRIRVRVKGLARNSVPSTALGSAQVTLTRAG